MSFDHEPNQVESTAQTLDEFLQKTSGQWIAREITLLERLQRNELECPQCGQTLAGEFIDENHYSGVYIYCLNLNACNFREP